MSKFLDLNGLAYYNNKIKEYFNTKVPAPPTTNGTYNLQCSVVNGVVTYSWVSIPSADGQSF